jgi:ABC-2 type transport system permease protein
LVAASDEKAERSVDKPFNLGSVIERSPDSARIILVSSNDFLRDQTLQYISSTEQAQYVNSLQFAANAIDWSLDDSGLMSIRSRGHFNRTLPPMERSVQMFWEYLNYGLATLALIAIAIFERRKRLVKHKLLLTLLAD